MYRKAILHLPTEYIKHIQHEDIDTDRDDNDIDNDNSNDNGKNHNNHEHDKRDNIYDITNDSVQISSHFLHPHYVHGALILNSSFIL